MLITQFIATASDGGLQHGEDLNDAIYISTTLTQLVDPHDMKNTANLRKDREPFGKISC